jgi:hypothetical protein
MAHPLGTDALFIGTTVGMLSGYVGGRVDRLLMGCVDVFYALPVTLLMLLFLVFVGSGMGVLCLAIGLTEWFVPARVIQARTLDLRCRTFVLSASAIGQFHCRILLGVEDVAGFVFSKITANVPPGSSGRIRRARHFPDTGHGVLSFEENFAKFRTEYDACCTSTFIFLDPRGFRKQKF